MNISKIVVVIVAMAALALSSGVCAQVASPKIVISNTNPNVEIPLEASSQVQVLSSGDLSVSCRLSGGSCPSTGTGGGANPPTVSLTPSVTSLTAGGAFTLNWTSTGDACYAVAPDNVTGWTTGGRAFPATGSQALSLVAGTYIFQLRCYSTGGNNIASAAQVTVTGTQTGSAYCAEYYAATGLPTTAGFNAYGFTRVDAVFGSVFPGVQPGGVTGLPVAVPWEFLDPSSNRYLSIPFVMTSENPDDSASQMTFNWGITQIPGVIGSLGITLTISPCAGDFRAAAPPVPVSSDVYARAACRAFGGGTSLTVDAVSADRGCFAPIGKTMFINIANYNMLQGTAPTQLQCLGGSSKCGVSMNLVN